MIRLIKEIKRCYLSFNSIDEAYGREPIKFDNMIYAIVCEVKYRLTHNGFFVRGFLRT